MRIAILYDPWLLSARGTLDLDGYRDDKRGMTGSEQCAIRLFEEWRDAGHEVDLFTNMERGEKGDTIGTQVNKTPECWLRAWHRRDHSDLTHDIAVSINCPDGLKEMHAKVRVCYALLNDFTFCKVGFEQHVDLFASPSAAHLEQVMTNPAWRAVEKSPQHPEGKAQYVPDAAKWVTVPLGCDPHRYGCECRGEYDCQKCDGSGRPKKVPGRVVYCSSPDRGLHWLLQEWPAIKRAVPHAHLRIFYRLQPWIDSFASMPFFPPIEALRARALFIGEALRRMSDPKWSIEVVGSVSRARIEREMAEAEVTAYPCDPSNDFTEGFSCSTLEACAARACPVITNADALGSLYGEAVPAIRRSNWMGTTWQEAWRRNVIECLTDPTKRNNINDRAEALARTMTWKATAEKLLAAAKERL